MGLASVPREAPSPWSFSPPRMRFVLFCHSLRSDWNHGNAHFLRGVVTDLHEEEQGWQPTHIKFADEADLLLIAPATANILAKLANGIADDALSCIALALNPKARLVLAPAMNGKMWLHSATQENVATLKSRGAEFIGPEEGLLSCGYEGLGRLWPVEKVANRALELVA